jgi:sulfate transport system ATP-binding protein
MGVVVKNLHKRFTGPDSAHAAVQGVSFEVNEGELVALLGPSGSGKSTILRLIAGLESPDLGEIRLNGENVTQMPVQRRGVGFVFQNYALFRQLTVFDNIAFGLEVQKVDKTRRGRRIEELLSLLGLKGLGGRYPHQLSGGQRQRVALARALAPEPKVLLLDEPFGAIDAKIRQELREWLRRLHDSIHVTSIFVTHDQEEALEISDKIIVVNSGLVEQEGTPQEIYNHPRTEFVANFVGSMNIHQATVKNGKLQVGPYLFQEGDLNGFQEGDEFRVFFRPQDIYVSRNLKSYALQGVLKRTTFLGINMKLEIEAENRFRFFAVIPQHIYMRERLEDGQPVSFQIEELSYINLRLGKTIQKLAVAGFEI